MSPVKRRKHTDHAFKFDPAKDVVELKGYSYGDLKLFIYEESFICHSMPACCVLMAGFSLNHESEKNVFFSRFLYLTVPRNS